MARRDLTIGSRGRTRFAGAPLTLGVRRQGDRMMWRGLRGAVLALVVAGCSGEENSCCQNLPSGGVYATFSVGSEVVHVTLTHPEGISQVRAVWAGTSEANIPNGQLVCSPAAWNQPWNWHLAPESVRMAEVTTEVCDAAPSYVEANCSTFGGGQYCPWSAAMTNLRDCSVDPACPQVPR